jgi:multiple sugar transport system substrate-binding protein
MKKMKKIVVLFVMIMMVSACGKTTDQGTENADTVASGAASNTTASKDTKIVEPIEIEFWHALGGSLGDGLHAIIDDYNSTQSTYMVKPVVVGSYSEIDEKLQAAYAGKTVPALVVGGSQDVFFQKGLVEYFEDYMPETYDKEDIVGGFLKAGTRDDKLAFAPAYGTSQVLYYNKAVLTEAGATVDDLGTWGTLAGLYDQVKGIDTGVNTIEYVWEPMWGNGNIADMASSNGGRYVSDDGLTVTINSPEWVEVLEQVRIWIHDDQKMRIHSGGQGWEYWYKTMDDWVYGKSLGYTGSPGDYVIAFDAVKKANEEGYINEFAVTHQPGFGNHDPAPYFSSLMYFIPKADNITEEQKIGAADFVTFATNTENTAAFSIATGYAAVRNSVLDFPEYQEYLTNNPDADAALKQIDQYAVPEWIDPTGGAIMDALTEAVDKVEIENIPAQKALDAAAEKAQRELDKIKQ